MKQRKIYKGILWGLFFIGMSILNLTVKAEEIEEQLTMELEGSGGVLILDALVKEDLQDWNKGTVSAKEIPVDVLKSFYGEISEWNKIETNEYETWQYQKEPVYAFSNNGWISFEDQTDLKSGSYAYEPVLEWKNEEEVLESAELILEELELPIKAVGILSNVYDKRETDFYAVRLQGILDGKEVAGLTRGNPAHPSNQGILEFYKGNVIQLEFASVYEVEESQEASLLPLEEILEKLKLFIENDWIKLEKEVRIEKIDLQYFLEWEGETVTFRPIWNFQATVSDEGNGFTTGNDDFFYIDGQTGELAQYREVIGFDQKEG